MRGRLAWFFNKGSSSVRLLKLVNRSKTLSRLPLRQKTGSLLVFLEETLLSVIWIDLADTFYELNTMRSSPLVVIVRGLTIAQIGSSVLLASLIVIDDSHFDLLLWWLWLVLPIDGCWAEELSEGFDRMLLIINAIWTLPICLIDIIVPLCSVACLLLKIFGRFKRIISGKQGDFNWLQRLLRLVIANFTLQVVINSLVLLLRLRPLGFAYVWP